MTHTPGPWRFDAGGDARIVAERVSVALVTRGVDEECDEQLQGPVFEANARLIAAAPDLLAACKAAEEYETHMLNAPLGTRLEQRRISLAALRAAIQKAEGR